MKKIGMYNISSFCTPGYFAEIRVVAGKLLYPISNIPT
ncbi:hypothetical protein GJA_2957 [Janthinobacterium agaricidamnosum NBRC 102515 = DSM 9628]|uniref:Uncharacterized protein n=1 Tax=Janthinobacterium agaricidamnosum NBRC 102515 = DSM 9628 TaxID=1349767 RepID=W0V8B2_9BURK|nr:hypothetical protein GJA_2957 [Janthinobacterium agaricidamnosum NBRC 102515 = DSM 9628]